MASATLTSKGQVTIPKKIREKLELRTGDRVDFIEENEGRVVMRKASISVEELEGLLYRPTTKPVSIEEMHQAARRRSGSKR